MKDEDIDKLFHDASERFIPPSAPEGAWDAFYAKKLSVNKKQRSGFISSIKEKIPFFFLPRLSWQFATACVLVLALGIWFGVERFGGKKNNQDNADSIAASSIIKNIDSSAALNNKNNPVQLNNDSTQNSVAANTNSGIFFSGNNNSEPNITGAFSKENKYPEFFSFGTVSTNANKYNNLISKIFLNKASTIILKNYNELYNQNITNNNALVVNKIDLSKETNPEANKKPSVPLDYDSWLVDQERQEKNKNNFSNADWQVALVGGTNLGVVGSDVSSNPGVNTGVMVQRRIADSRFSVETGVVRESMNYAVDNSNYTPNGKSVPASVSNINGSCIMMDVPVNLRFDVVHSKSNNAFVSAGASAMWMSNQNYNYQYTSGGSTTQVSKDLGSQGKTAYAVTNVSIGYEHHFNKTAIQVAPYVKIPLSNVGYGNIALGSLGAQISIKQSF